MNNTTTTTKTITSATHLWHKGDDRYREDVLVAFFERVDGAGEVDERVDDQILRRTAVWKHEDARRL